MLKGLMFWMTNRCLRRFLGAFNIQLCVWAMFNLSATVRGWEEHVLVLNSSCRSYPISFAGAYENWFIRSVSGITGRRKRQIENSLRENDFQCQLCGGSLMLSRHDWSDHLYRSIWFLERLSWMLITVRKPKRSLNQWRVKTGKKKKKKT